MRWCSVDLAPRPRPPQRRAGGDRALAEGEQPGASGGERIVDARPPSRAAAGVPPGAQVAAEVHQHAAHTPYPGAEQLGRDDVGRVPLADAAEVERDAGREPHRGHDGVELHARRSQGPRAQARSPARPRAAPPRRSRGRSPRLRGRRAPSGRSDRRSSRHASTARAIRAKVSADTTTGAPPASLSRHSSLVGRKRDHRASRASRAVAASSPSSAIAAASAPTANTSTSVPIARNCAGGASTPPFTAKPYEKPGARAAAHVTDPPRVLP